MMEVVFELPMELPEGAGRPSTKLVYQLLKRAILAGDLAPNTKLPPTRVAGRHFRLSRNSIVSIYERLATEGLVVSLRGSGTFVASNRIRSSRDVSRFAKDSIDGSAWIGRAWGDESVARSMWFWTEQDTLDSSAEWIELRPGLVDFTLFPFREFRRSMTKALRRMERSPPIAKSPQRSQGNFRLRQAIVDHATLMRAVVCEPEDIIVTSGAQQAFDLLAKVFVEPQRTVVVVEDPCYPPMVAAFRAAGALIRPVPVDSGGIIVDQIPSDARLICVCPSNQFPLGITMSAERRRQLLAFAKEKRALIIEDDYDGEFRAEGEPLRAIYSQDSTDLVFYIGTFSKCMFAPLRLGYLIAPEWAIDALVLAKNCADWHCSSVIQSATASFISEGSLSAHVAKMRSVYRNRRSALLDALSTLLAGRLRPMISNYGMHLATEGDAAIDWDTVAEKAQANGVQLHSLSRYYSGNAVPGLLFALGAESEQRLILAVERLSALLR
jgi:GntR family transcriptional regulator/MocR family aminotransferase